jgi:hypothetical protein
VVKTFFPANAVIPPSILIYFSIADKSLIHRGQLGSRDRGRVERLY